MEEDLSANSQLKTLPAETVMMQSSSISGRFPRMLSGSMRVMREDEDGREILHYYIKSGESCNPYPVLLKKLHNFWLLNIAIHDENELQN